MAMMAMTTSSSISVNARRGRRRAIPRLGFMVELQEDRVLSIIHVTTTDSQFASEQLENSDTDRWAPVRPRRNSLQLFGILHHRRIARRLIIEARLRSGLRGSMPAGSSPD